jgi:hypothetical protein
MMALCHLETRGNDRMAYRVRIFLRRPDQNAGGYIGERYLRDMPRVRGRVTFESGDVVQTGMVERIVPENWQPASELIPTVHVLEDVET